MTSFSALARDGIDQLNIYEPGRPIDEVTRELGLTAPPIKLASNENALGPSPRAIGAMQAAAGEMHRYPDGGCFHLRQALAAHLDVPPECILAGNGSNELLELIGRVFLGPDVSIVVSQFAFVVYRLVAEAFGAGIIEVPARDFSHDLSAMVDAITDKTRILYVANPNNPTGTMVTPEAIDRLMDQVPEHVIVCFDEAYIELVGPEDAPDTLRYVREGRNAVILRTFSKAYGLAGLRLGYAIAPTECVSLMNRVRQPFNVNAMAQAAAIAALEDTEHVETTRRIVQDGLEFLENGLLELGLPVVRSKANLILAKVGDGRSVYEGLMRRGVIVRPMDGYGLGQYIRITVGTREENERVITALADELGSDG